MDHQYSLLSVEERCSALGITEDDLWPLYRHVCSAEMLYEPLPGDWAAIHRQVCDRLGREQVLRNSDIGQAVIMFYPKLGLYPALRRNKESTPAEVVLEKRRLFMYPGPQFEELFAHVQLLGRAIHAADKTQERSGDISDKEAVSKGLGALRELFPGPEGEPTANGGEADNSKILSAKGHQVYFGKFSVYLERPRTKDFLRNGLYSHLLDFDETVGKRTLSAKTLRELRGMHPGPTYSGLIERMHSPERIQIKGGKWHDPILNDSVNVGPGPSGWAPNLFLNGNETDGFNAYLITLHQRLLNNSASGMRYLLACELIPVQKAIDGDILPEVIPEVLYVSMVSCALCSQLGFLSNSLLPNQLDFDAEDGQLAIQRAVMLASCDPWRLARRFFNMTQLRFVHLPNMLDRGVIADQVYHHAPRLLGLVRATHGQPATLIVNGVHRRERKQCPVDDALSAELGSSLYVSGEHTESTARCLAARLFGEPPCLSAEILSCQGVRRGDPLEKLLVAFGMRAFIESLQQRLGSEHVVLAQFDTVVVLSPGDPARKQTTGKHVLRIAKQMSADRSNPLWTHSAPHGLTLDTNGSRVYTIKDVTKGDGILLFGKIVGTTEWCELLAQQRVLKVLRRVKKIRECPHCPLEERQDLQRALLEQIQLYVLILQRPRARHPLEQGTMLMLLGQILTSLGEIGATPLFAVAQSVTRAAMERADSILMHRVHLLSSTKQRTASRTARKGRRGRK